MLGLGLGISKHSKKMGAAIPYSADALHYSNYVSDTTRIDRTGKYDRTSVPSKKFVGNGSGTYIRFADFVSTALTYYDLTTKAEVVTATDANGDFIIPSNGVAYIDIAGYRWIAEDIDQPTVGAQTTFYDTTGVYQAQAFLTHALWVTESVQASEVALSDMYGTTFAGALGKNKFRIDTGSIASSGITITSTVDGYLINGTATANKYFKLTGTFDVQNSPPASWNENTYIKISAEEYTFNIGVVSGTVVGSRNFYLRDTDGNSVFSTASSKTETFADDVDISGFSLLALYGVVFDNYLIKPQLELGSTATAYESWEGYWKDEGLTLPYSDDQPLHALQLADGTFSRQYNKAWLENGEHGVMSGAEIGRIKHQVTRCDDAGIADVSGGYFTLAQNYPLVQSADLTDTLVDDHTLDAPTNAIVAVSGLAVKIGDQIFSKQVDGDLKKLLVYDKAMSAGEVTKIERFIG